MDLTENMIEHIATEVFGTTEFEYEGTNFSVKAPWKRMKLVESVREHTGIDTLAWTDRDSALKDIEKLQLSDLQKSEIDKHQSLGTLTAFLFEEFVEDRLIQPTIIYDYPVEVSPLAKRCEDDRFTQRFEVFALGMELGNNYSELNDPIDLKKRFIEEKNKEKAGFDEAHQTDEDYLEAIEYGFPPTCGLGIGIDRLVMIMTNAKSIREVITFPTLRPIGNKNDKS
jgi:lysyl-tRNA synthetase class 2